MDPNGNIDTSKPLYWQAVYLSNGCLTIWLDKPYTVSLFNAKDGTGSGNGYISSITSPFAPYDTKPNTHGFYGNYAYSTLRDVTLNIFSLLNDELYGLSTFV